MLPYFDLIASGRYGVARVRLRRHLAVHPDDGQAVFLFGLTHHRQKRYDAACEHFDRAVELAPRFDAAWYFRGWASYWAGRPEVARASFERHRRLRPEAADTWHGLGLLALDAGTPEEAATCFIAAESRFAAGDNPRGRSKALIGLSDAHRMTGHLEDAVAALEQALRLYPDHYEGWQRLARLRRRLGDPDGAARATEAYEAARARVRPEISDTGSGAP